MKRLLLAGFLLLAPLAGVCAESQRPGNPRGYETDILLETFGFGAEDIDLDIARVVQGCAARDCIPSIDQPRFLPAAEVNFLDPDDLVLTLELYGDARAYPTRILDRHEIVNDRFDSTPVAVTYCPLCGSGLAFLRVIDGEETGFGVSGLLHNNDLILYDRRTESIWQQITGRALAGPKRGERLQMIPVGMSLWAGWREAHPGGRVLEPPLAAEAYAEKAYGDYAKSDRLLFPVSVQDARLHPKRVVFGLELGDRSVAVDAAWLKEKESWRHEIDGRTVELRWSDGNGVSGRIDGDTIPVHRLYWFAWYSFHPDTALVGAEAD